MSTNLEVFAEGFGAHSALQLKAQALAAVGQRAFWYGVTGGRLTVMTLQFALATEVQVTHVTGEELHPNVGETVGDAGSMVRKGGPTHSAEPKLRQVGLGMSSNGSWVCWERHCAGFT